MSVNWVAYGHEELRHEELRHEGLTVRERIHPRSPTPADAGRLAAVDRMEPHEVAAELASVLGAKLTAAAGGVTSTRLVREWIAEEHKPTRPTALATALKAARTIADRDGDIVAQRWFVGTNHLLGHRSPIEVLRENSAESRTRVMRAAVAFVA